MSRLLLGGAAALLVSACAANPKNLHPDTSVKDGASASAATAPGSASDASATATPAPSTDATSASEACGLGVVRVRFAFDSAQLDEPAMKALREDADCLSRRKPSTLVIEGHCDERGTAQYNIALGARRADAVRKYLAALGVKTQFDTVSFGKELPVAEGASESAWAQNRRAELRLPGEKRSDGQLVAGR
jgi:peptidoglycan-associated lipoprotein